MTGVDLGFVPVVRTPSVGTAATALNARAFTRGSVVHVPDTAGPLDRSDTEALVAHELAHVVQQRALGARVQQSQELGDRLELVAREVEAAYRGRRSADTVGDLLAGEPGTPAEAARTPPAAGPPAEPSEEPSDEPPAEPSTELSAEPLDGIPGGSPALGQLSWTPQHGFRTEPVAAPVQPALVSDLAGPPEPAARPAEPAGTSAPDAVPVPLASPGQGGAGDPLGGGAPPPGPRGEPAGSDAARASHADLVDLADLDDETVARLASRIGARLTVSPVDTRDPELLDQLAVRLYGRLRSRLRHELIADRERVGLLTEFH